MRRLHALLLAAGLAAAPTSAVAGPSNSPPDSKAQAGKGHGPNVQRFEWSMFSSKGRLGVMVMSLTPELRSHFGADQDRGVLVARVEPGSAAAQAGVAVGDVLVEVRGTPVDGATDVMHALDGANKGDRVALRVIRDGKPLSLTATMTDDASAVGSTSGFERRMFEGPFFDDPFPGFDWFFDWFRQRTQPPSKGRPLETTRT